MNLLYPFLCWVFKPIYLIDFLALVLNSLRNLLFKANLVCFVSPGFFPELVYMQKYIWMQLFRFPYSRCMHRPHNFIRLAMWEFGFLCIWHVLFVVLKKVCKRMQKKDFQLSNFEGVGRGGGRQPQKRLELSSNMQTAFERIGKWLKYLPLALNRSCGGGKINQMP